MIYESKTHITNNHPKNSQVHAYSLQGEYLGHVDGIELFSEAYFDKPDTKWKQRIYNRDTYTFTVYGEVMKTVDVYEVVVTQNLVILGYRRIEK